MRRTLTFGARKEPLLRGLRYSHPLLYLRAVVGIGERTRGRIVAAIAVLMLLLVSCGDDLAVGAGDTAPPDGDLSTVSEDDLVDVGAALEATEAAGTSTFVMRQAVDGEVQEIGEGSLDLDADRVDVVTPFGSQRYDGRTVYLQLPVEGAPPWARTELDQLGAAGDEPSPGATDPRTHLRIVGQAVDAELAETTDLDGVELAVIRATADLGTTRDEVLAELEAPDALPDDQPDAFDPEILDDAADAFREHDGQLPVEISVDADQRIWRVAYDMANWPDGGEQPGEFVLHLRDFGTDVDIEMPPAEEVEDLEDIQPPTSPSP